MPATALWARAVVGSDNRTTNTASEVDRRHVIRSLRLYAKFVAGTLAPPCAFCKRNAEIPRDQLRSLGTNARNRRGLSSRMCLTVASLTPAFTSIGTNAVTV